MRTRQFQNFMANQLKNYKVVRTIEQKQKQKKKSKVFVHYFLKFLNRLSLGNWSHSPLEKFLVLSGVGKGFPWLWCELLGNILGNPLGGSLRRVVSVTLLIVHSLSSCS